MVNYTASAQGSTGSLSVFFEDGSSKTISSAHPAYSETVAYLLSTPASEHDEDHLKELLNPALRIGRALQEVDPKFGFDLYTLSYDGFPLSGPLAELIKERLSSGKGDWERFVRFAARLEANPSFRAKEGLYSWVTRQGLTILDDGRFVAHKAVSVNGLSLHSGPNNFINGTLFGKPGVNYNVPHAVGSVISKRRQDVDDSQVACSTGLHVGTLNYATGFGPVLLTVAVAPEDIVGGDESFKIRTSRYEVLGMNENKVEFVGGSYEIVDRSEEVSAGEFAFADGARLFSREVEFKPETEERAEFNSLSTAGRNLYLNLRNLLAKSHDAAYETALNAYGTWKEFLERQERFKREEEETAADEVILDTDLEPGMFEEQNLAHYAENVPALARDLADTTLGHKPLARKWSRLTTESSVRRYRKANGIQVSTWTKVKDAIS